jgi:hypothetical protein
VAVVGLLACVACAKSDDDHATAARRTTTTSRAEAAGAVTTTPAARPGSGGETSPTTLAAAADALGFPRAGTYAFHDRITPDDGSAKTDKDTYFTLSTNGTAVRVRESDKTGSTRSAAFYDERHDDDGLWLVASATSGGTCEWKPKVASLPLRVVEGGSVTTTSTCATDATTLTMTTTVTFKALRTVAVNGQALRCIDVTRHRVLSDPSATVTSDATDTFSFALGIRIGTVEHTVTKAANATTGFTRNLVLVSPPS